MPAVPHIAATFLTCRFVAAVTSQHLGPLPAFPLRDPTPLAIRLPTRLSVFPAAVDKSRVDPYQSMIGMMLAMIRVLAAHAAHVY